MTPRYFRFYIGVRATSNAIPLLGDGLSELKAFVPGINGQSTARDSTVDLSRFAVGALLLPTLTYST